MHAVESCFSQDLGCGLQLSKEKTSSPMFSQKLCEILQQLFVRIPLGDCSSNLLRQVKRSKKVFQIFNRHLNPLSANHTKWSNILKQFASWWVKVNRNIPYCYLWFCSLSLLLPLNKYLLRILSRDLPPNVLLQNIVQVHILWNVDTAECEY